MWAVLIGPLPPFLPKTADNPEGIDPVIFDKALAAISADRLAAIKVFLDAFYNVDVLGGSRVSDQVWHHSFNVAAAGSAKATVESVSACLEDFRGDLDRINIPVLVLQGDEDRVLAKEATGDRLPGLLRDIRHVVIRGGPHAIYWTHDLEVNRKPSSILSIRFGFSPKPEPRCRRPTRVTGLFRSAVAVAPGTTAQGARLSVPVYSPFCSKRTRFAGCTSEPGSRVQ